MSLVLVFLAGLAASPTAPADPARAPHIAPAAAQAAEGYAELRAEWMRALDGWYAEVEEGRRAGRKRRENPPHPAVAFWTRFDAAAMAGEGRAVLWMLEHLREAGGSIADRRERAARVLSLVESAGVADWVGEALPGLADRRREVDEERLGALVTAHSAADRPASVRVGALLARAGLLKSSEAEQAAELRLEAAALATDPAASLPQRMLDLVGRVVAAELQRAEARHFNASYEVRDGELVERDGAPPDPEERFRPLLEDLAELGSTTARVWYLTHAYGMDDGAAPRVWSYLESLDRAALTAIDMRALIQHAGFLMGGKDPRRVEARLLELVRGSALHELPGFLVLLGEQLATTSTIGLFLSDDEDPSQEEQDAVRARGVALLEEVIETYPGTPAAQAAQALLFRATRLVVGQKVPDFDAVDVDGEAFKLSDYEGQVTVVDFWGFW